MRQVLPAVSKALQKTLLAAAIVVSPAIVSSIATQVAPGQQLLVSGSAFAQVKANNKHANEKRKFPNVTEAFGKRIQEAANALQPPDGSNEKPNPKKTLEILNELAQRSKNNEYEKVLLNQYSGYAYLGLENSNKAIESFSKVMTLAPNMPVATEAQTLLIIGQLYSQQENPKKALETLLKWTTYVDSLRPEQSYMFAALYYQLEDNKNALLNISEAIKNQEALGKTPSESWYQMQLGLIFEKEQYKEGLPILEKLIKYYSSPKYWKQLSQVYRVIGRDKESLSALEACYLQGGLDKEKDLVNLAYIFLDGEVPYKAAKVLKKGIYDTKTIEPTAKNLKLLADAYRMAQNSKESLVEYEKAASKSTDGELIYGLAGAYLANDKFADAAKWGKEALNKGRSSIKRVDQANFVVAQAELEMKHYDEAIKYFKEAGKDARSAKTATQWINYVEKEKEKAQLAAKQ